MTNPSMDRWDAQHPRRNELQHWLRPDWKCEAMRSRYPEEVPEVAHAMATVQSLLVQPGESTLERTFTMLAGKWRADTALMSSATDMAMHPAYQRIIGMGHQVVPLILRELSREPDHWFWALTAITRENPVSPEDAGKIRKMTHMWLEYGKQRGLLPADDSPGA